MAKKGVVRGFFGSLVDVRKWVNFDEIAGEASLIKRIFNDLRQTKPTTPSTKSASFEEAVRILQLSEEDIKSRSRYFFWYCMIYLASAFALIGYVIYLFNTTDRILAILVSLILVVLMLVYALREYLLYMQMKLRKVGCTFKDCKDFIFKRGK